MAKTTPFASRIQPFPAPSRDCAVLYAGRWEDSVSSPQVHLHACSKAIIIRRTIVPSLVGEALANLAPLTHQASHGLPHVHRRCTTSDPAKAKASSHRPSTIGPSIDCPEAHASDGFPGFPGSYAALDIAPSPPIPLPSARPLPLPPSCIHLKLCAHRKHAGRTLHDSPNTPADSHICQLLS
jgi:hypothetical protein